MHYFIWLKDHRPSYVAVLSSVRLQCNTILAAFPVPGVISAAHAAVVL